MTWKDYLHYIKGTIINILFLLHPILLKASMSMFPCTTIDDTQYLDIDMEEECWTGDHWIYATVVAIPSFVLWGIGLPCMAFMILFRLNKAKKLTKKSNKEVYGFLFLGYLPKKYWWELVVLCNKIFILANLIYLNRVSTIVQALTGLLFLIIAIYL